MEGYSWSRLDFIRNLARKFYHQDGQMEKAIYYYSEDCVKCRFLEPHVEKRAEENGIKLEKRLYTIAENEITSVPMLLRNNTQYDYESIVYLLQKK